MNSLLIRTTLAFGLAVAPFLATPKEAAAQSFELEIGRDGPRLRMQDGDCDPRFERCRDDFGERRRPRDRDRFCTEDRALDKAERMGIRRARVIDAGRRTIEVGGRDRYGGRVSVLFGRDPRCPVLD